MSPDPAAAAAVDGLGSCCCCCPSCGDSLLRLGDGSRTAEDPSPDPDIILMSWLRA